MEGTNPDSEAFFDEVGDGVHRGDRRRAQRRVRAVGRRARPLRHLDRRRHHARRRRDRHHLDRRVRRRRRARPDRRLRRRTRASTTTSSRASSSRAPTTTSSTACPGTPACARSSTAPTSSRSSASKPPTTLGRDRRGRRGHQGRAPRHDRRSPFPATPSSRVYPWVWGAGGEVADAGRRRVGLGPRQRRVAGGHRVLHRPRDRARLLVGRRDHVEGDRRARQLRAGQRRHGPHGLVDAGGDRREERRPRGQVRRDRRSPARTAASPRRCSAARTCRCSRRPTNKDLALAFVELMTTGEFAEQWGEQSGLLPRPDSRCSTRPWSRDDPLVAPFADADRRRRRHRAGDAELRRRAGEEDDEHHDPGDPLRAEGRSSRPPTDAAAEMNDDHERQLSRRIDHSGSSRRSREERTAPRAGAAAPGSRTTPDRPPSGPGCCSRPRSLVLAVLLLWPLVRVVPLLAAGLRPARDRHRASRTGSASTTTPRSSPSPTLWTVVLPEHRRLRGARRRRHRRARHRRRRAAGLARHLLAHRRRQRHHGRLGHARRHRHLRLGVDLRRRPRHLQRDCSRRSGCRTSPSTGSPTADTFYAHRAAQRHPPRLPVRGHHRPRGPARRAEGDARGRRDGRRRRVAPLLPDHRAAA